MALISLRQLLDHAAEHAYGVPAFNVNNLEQVQAIMQAAAECDSPVIMQASAGARKYAGEAFLRHLVIAAIETYPDIPVVMHQDHGASRVMDCADTNMHVDGASPGPSIPTDRQTVASKRTEHDPHSTH
ncbi:D-tagatose-1,6-bisphosphate aldolase subunit GatY [Paraburkholderia aspalathi]|uniref:D-tagatose-1,6-bisphosphate aldolase subunit GatY n=1 Tax=Paraburkholderia aspalathi TaxID=1324617 RepID=A0ABM8S7B1_9BURK|nr:D-tagatose-1,6-bisphosphate aldolase subunit GatY [Paraburkholderia aspalathi]CAE6793301.1 D-tagatose-1,6-bisphosphate aldolase subunit GatY [Paraburkholderia aspalathi]